MKEPPAYTKRYQDPKIGIEELFFRSSRLIRTGEEPAPLKRVTRAPSERWTIWLIVAFAGLVLTALFLALIADVEWWRGVGAGAARHI